ncbi:hypothetical protein BOTBODRAFT_176913 [Botryobasidium botryosum FD-172 SS1]|uniref:Uncharacterized protein n=1 Tax=Botryobasidium botryosum (strain FD-172 SS1) TaxID=930990 RepID=A0A067MB64_BOTB1|nr:hypothetical protein BOTBODRAFT_176913 [Botryobasidium botryosum FD-172 SS1]
MPPKPKSSEIDDIFASKGKLKDSPKSPPTAKKDTKKKKRSKEKAATSAVELDTVGVESTSTSNSKSKVVPETILDPSVPAKKPDAIAAPASRKRKQTEQESAQEQRFADSRGTGPRRMTEEGYAIYKEDELGISAEGGGAHFSVSSPASQNPDIGFFPSRYSIMSFRLRLL